MRLSGVDGAALRGLLACIYEQHAAIDAESVEALLAASNYLDVPSVTEACCAWLVGGLCPETAAATLAVAARHGCAALQAESVSPLFGPGFLPGWLAGSRRPLRRGAALCFSGLRLCCMHAS